MRKRSDVLGTVGDVKETRTSATIAGLLHDYMVRTGSTEAELGELLGVDQTQVGRWKRGETVPRPANLDGLADLLDVDVDELEVARVESERVRDEVKARKRVDPETELRKVRDELRKARARIARLERELGR